MDADTKIGGGSVRFPETRISAIALAQSPDESERRQAHGAIIEAYWKPVYKYLRLRRKLNNESAKDLTQGFFARLGLHIFKQLLLVINEMIAFLVWGFGHCGHGLVSGDGRPAAATADHNLLFAINVPIRL